MANGKATASFFENGSTTQFEYCYKLYPEVLKMKAEKRSKKPQELIRLDQWFQNELPTLIKARGKDAHLVYDELVQAMKWKQSRGKFYPQLSYLVKVNTPRAVIQETKKAFRKLPNLEQAITALSNLKGVGTTMASALLTAAAPDSAPFMADECLMAIPEIEGIDYTTKEYLNFVQHIQSTVERLNAEVGGETPHWSPHRVELALWAHYVANDLSPELLDEMPPPGAAPGGVAATNGKTTTTTTTTTATTAASKVLDGDDTNDGVVGVVDDESEFGSTSNQLADFINLSALLPAAAAPKSKNNSNTAALQDGDSNFVSNDSTSQEPIIDDNTTQTTATTTSTEDGEEREERAALASDSESNLEAPQQQHNKNPPAAVVDVAAAALPLNNNKQLNNNGQTTVAAPTVAATAPNEAATVAAAAAPANGNGAAATAASAADELDDDEEEEDEDDVDGDEEDDDDDEEEEELEAEESNSSSSNNLRASSKLQHLTATTATTDSALTAPSIGQKRTALHCELEASATDGAAAAETAADKSPELKKLRSD
ncbi:hypothetical protein KR044_007523 [Drosophila immigrans]|nr:hypothetical protein KR044_007523 [Drosophila immigrans]